MDTTTALTIEDVDQLVRIVAELLPIPTALDADMDYGALQIYLGEETDESTGRPFTRAGIDPEDPTTVWWLDFEAGGRQKFSTLDATASPQEVAEWITANAEIPVQAKAV
ncbi:hypothetical protein [Arthrobacter woluwensis]|uniref:Uncharacterized protein n=1 Tax=Arthrobacter woluwensis TaxID=156980 RepID=A0A1H4I762_9MICC|nr:hypothetical protein [Arthrobacter woluwensis]SEB29745.1 hypothetical protein SAMN04489745_0078 [Arthrobacter woluwensis]